MLTDAGLPVLLSEVGPPVLRWLDRTLGRLHGYVRAWRAALEADCMWCTLDAGDGCACGGAA